MHVRLTSLLYRLLHGPNRTGRKNAASPQCRKLWAEPLESRFALSTLVDPVLVPDPLATPTDPAPPAVVSTDPTAPSAAPAPTSPTPTDPAAIPPADPMGTNAAPVIHDFTFTILENWCTLRGWVSDDQIPSGDTVEFSGIITGQTVVGADFYFSYIFQISPEFHGEITAVTHDFMGLASNEPSVTI